jgi:hypothetical protein
MTDSVQASDPINIKDRVVSRIAEDGLGFIWDTGMAGITFRADRITPYFGNGLQAEVRVTVNDRHVHMNNYVLSDQKHRENLIAALMKNSVFKNWKLVGNEWLQDTVEQFCSGILIKYRSKIRQYHTRPAPKRPTQYLLDKLILKGRRPNLLFAPGGSGKSYFVLAVCIALMTKRSVGQLSTLDGIVPAYFDWEDEFDIFNDRANTVARGMGLEVPEIPYFEMSGNITDQIHEIAKIMRDNGANLGIIDSMSAAAGATGPGSDWTAVASRVFDALQLVPDVTWLIIGHVTKSDVKDKEPSGSMFGSIQQMNRASNAWEVRSEQEPDSNVVHMKFYDAKWNQTGKRGTVGMQMEFDGDAVIFSTESPDTIPSNVADRMTVELMNGRRLSPKDLARKLGVQEGSIRTAASRFKERFDRDDNNMLVLNRDWSHDDEPAAPSQPLPTELSDPDAEKSLPW